MPRKTASPKTDAVKKTTRKKKVEDAVVEAAVAETPAVADAPAAEKPVKKRGRKPAVKKPEPEKHDIVKVATLAPGELKELINAPAPTTPFPASDDPSKDIVQTARKPRAKKADKKAEPVLSTLVQVGDAEYDISDIAAKAYKAYKSTHKRKAVTEFRVYVKPEEGVAYFTVNGEGSPDFKINL
jgi:hypothetical protein